MKVNGHHMSKEIPELKFLLSEVEKAYGRGVHTTTDFEALSVVIEHDINERLSCSTLKRLWGYVSNHSSPSLATLNILSRYVGKRDFLAFCEAIKRRELFESGFFTSDCISASDLQPGIPRAAAPRRKQAAATGKGTAVSRIWSYHTNLNTNPTLSKSIAKAPDML